MIGFAEIPKGANGQCSNTFSFTGNPQMVTSGIKLPGHYSGNFDLKSGAGIESWSPCGGSTAILNMNTACAITPTSLPALIAVSRGPFMSARPERVTNTWGKTGRSHQRQAHCQVCRQVAPMPQVSHRAYTMVLLQDLPASLTSFEVRETLFQRGARDLSLGLLMGLMYARRLCFTCL
jgi:hypothetical protein